MKIPIELNPLPKFLCDLPLQDALLLMARIFTAAVFWQSGQTKVDGWQLNETALFLFQEEYRLPWLDPTLAASLAALAEHLLPLLLWLGLGTRLAAGGLLMMTLVIQTLVYPDAWPTHGTWAVALALLVLHGPGRWSLDHGLRQFRRRSAEATRQPCHEHSDPETCGRSGS